MATRFSLVLWLVWLLPHFAIADQSKPQKNEKDRPVIGVYFDEPLKLVEPFAKDFQRSCTCVETAFALFPRVLEPPSGISPAVSLRPDDAVLRVIRDGVDARWIDLNGTPLPRMLITGRGVPPLNGDAAINAGVRGYRRLAERGDADAQASLGYLYAVGIGVPQSDELAAYWYGQAAQRSGTEAMWALAAMYALGRGVPQDDRAAAYWLLHSGSTHLLADTYACGLGVDQDFQRARVFYEAAAEGGQADAQYQLGMMYLKGCGAPQEDKLASEWLEKAANYGHPDAQIAFSEMMAEGSARGYPDPFSAYVMADLARSRLPDEDLSRDRARSARDRAAAMLSADELASARSMVQSMLDNDKAIQAEWIKVSRPRVRLKK